MILLFILQLLFFKSLIGYATQAPCAQVELGGQKIFCIYEGLASFTAQERASAFNDRLLTVSRDQNFLSESISSKSEGSFTNIIANESVLITITEEDALMHKLDRQLLADEVIRRIEFALEEVRQRQHPQSLLFSLIYSALATIAFVGILFFLSFLSSRFQNWVQSYKGTLIRSIRIYSHELLTGARIAAGLLWLATTGRIVLTFALVCFYFFLVLSFFQATADLSSKLFGYIIDPIAHIFSVSLSFIPDLFFILTIGFATRYILMFIRFIFLEIESGNLQIKGFFADWADPTYKLIRLLVLAFAFVMIFPYLPGSNSPAFQGISVFLGVLISLGSSSAISNMVAGVVITYMRPFKIGDRVKIADTTGNVLDKTLLVTRVRSIKNMEITIPNSMVLGSHIINYSADASSTGLILNTTVTIGYDAPWRKVHEILKNAAERTGLLCQVPKPFVLQTALGDFYVSYELNAYTRQPNEMAQIYSELNQNIQDCFNEAGVEIMSPHYESHRDGNKSTIPVEVAGGRAT